MNSNTNVGEVIGTAGNKRFILKSKKVRMAETPEEEYNRLKKLIEEDKKRKIELDEKIAMIERMTGMSIKFTPNGPIRSSIIEIKIGDIIKKKCSWSWRHYEFWKIIKITPKMFSVVKLKSRRVKKDNDGDFYGYYIDTCVNDIEYTPNYENGLYRNFKKTEIKPNMINDLSYEWECYAD